MNIKQFVLILFAGIFFSFSLPKHIQKKVNKEIKQTFGIESFRFTSVSIDQKIASTIPSEFGTDNFFKIENDNKLLGYAYISKAPSKTDEFDYLVLLDSKLVILKSKVLIYREDYGGEIGSKRWLKQFIGKTSGDTLRYGDNIVAISGATISVRSMTNAVNDLLKSLKVLHDKQILIWN